MSEKSEKKAEKQAEKPAQVKELHDGILSEALHSITTADLNPAFVETVD